MKSQIEERKILFMRLSQQETVIEQKDPARFDEWDFS
jgi:hypothetical protein